MTDRNDRESGGVGAGVTPLLEIEGIWVKLECANPGGSVKDRIADYMLRAAIERGELRPGDTVVEATSGNTGIALARVGRSLGLQVLVFMPEHMSPERRRIMERAGAQVVLTSRVTSFAGACAQRDAYAGRAGYYIPDQFGNPDNVRCQRDTLGAELVSQLRARGVDSPAAFVTGVGTGGTLMGVSEALREINPALHVVAVEPAESAVMSGGAPGEHGIMGIGDGFIPALLDMQIVDEVIAIATADAVAEARRLQAEHGLCVGVSSGANFLAARRVAERWGGVATVFADSADRYRSMGLGEVACEGLPCALQARCEARTEEMLGEERDD